MAAEIKNGTLRFSKRSNSGFNPDGKNWRELTPLVRALIAWRSLGHTGLTVWALASILRKNVLEVAEELHTTQYVFGQFCQVVLAPVFRMDGDMRDGFFIFGGDKNNNAWRCEDEGLMLKKQAALLLQYPHPAHRGFHDGKGVEKSVFATGKNRFALFNTLRAAATGDTPHGQLRAFYLNEVKNTKKEKA